MISESLISPWRVLAVGNLFLLLATITAGDDGVHIFSSLDQLVTSSTLRWVPHTQLEANGNNDLVVGGLEMLPKTEENDAVSGNTNNAGMDSKPIYVCRAIDNGIAVSGSQVKGERECVVSLWGTVRSHKRYDLLENVENAARLEWVYWYKYNWPLTGAVATSDTLFVARHNRSTNKENGPSGSSDIGVTHYIGRFDSKDGLGKITYIKNGVEESVESGEILVETEPTSYKLTNIIFKNKQKRMMKNEPLILGEATLTNSDTTGENIAKAFGYSYNYSSFWGQGHGILKGLNMSITLANGTKYPDILWGAETNEKRESVYEVKVYLEPGTAVNVTLRGKYTEAEVPYDANLVSRYKDGIKLTRVLNGIYRENTIAEVEPKFGPVYYLSNFTLVPTTTTTTTTTTQSPIENPAVNRHENEDDNPDGNLVVPPGKKGGDGNSMGVDSDGPLSLKNKLDTATGQSAAPRILPSDGIPILLLSGILLLVAFPDRPTS